MITHAENLSDQTPELIFNIRRFQINYPMNIKIHLRYSNFS